MIKTLNPYSSTAKTAEIMSRYRPIAPKPEVPENARDESSGMSQKIRQSPYLRNLWPQLQARSSRSRKRGRAAALSPPTLKRAKTHVFGIPSHVPSAAKNLSFNCFSHGTQLSGLSNFEISSTPPASFVTLPLLPCPPSVSSLNFMGSSAGEKGIDLNAVAEIPEEKDLLKQLQGAPFSSSVIAPQPIRPVGSSISVGCIIENPILTSPMQVPKKAEEVEEEIESEALPVIVSDSNNEVRLANSAYNEMIGQAEWPWLDSMVRGEGRVGVGGRRICGAVMLHMCDQRVPFEWKGFSCWVRIEWENEGKKKCIRTFCDAMRLSCGSKDYQYTWRFHTTNNKKEASQCSTNV
ncbi:DROUGHT RESPONSE GENE [Hibiscus trionum]|uniref:DROUGHT RESPONSE protein n=1 Tax=Hibiscus trionum TaxID=183268 RepID=A0A9W7M6V1_HIBTR|nr:DROUGHT RESPONSE GENE [Hibiscus trionum]